MQQKKWHYYKKNLKSEIFLKWIKDFYKFYFHVKDLNS